MTLLEIEYGKTEWRRDEDVANAEAQRRAILTRDADEPLDRTAIWFSDLGALTRLPDELAEIDGLTRLIIGDAKTPDGAHHGPPQRLQDIAVLAKLTNLTELNLTDSGVTDLQLIAGLQKLQILEMSETRITDVAPLTNLTALQNLYLSGIRIADIAPLSNLTALQNLDLSRTQIADFTPLAKLTALQNLNLGGTQIADLHILLQIPTFASLNAKSLSFARTPLAKSDRRWEMLAGIPAQRAARDVVLYLRGEHPDLQPPAEGAQQSTGQAGMAANSPVALTDRDGRAEIADATAFQPPVPLDASQNSASLEGLHATAQALALADELQHGVNVNRVLLRRVERYAMVADPKKDPSFALLEGTMVILRPMVTDRYTCDALDVGLVEGLKQLVALHDSFGGPSATPDPLPQLPSVPETPQATEHATEAIQQLGEFIQDAAKGGFVGNSVVVAINSTVDVANAANAPLPPDASEKDKQERKGLWSWVLRMGGGLTKAMEMHGKAHGWATSPAGQALIHRVTELLSSFGPYFTP